MLADEQILPEYLKALDNSRTFADSTNPLNRASICPISDSDTIRECTKSACASVLSGNNSRLKTAIQIGAVLESASGRSSSLRKIFLAIARASEPFRKGQRPHTNPIAESRALTFSSTSGVHDHGTPALAHQPKHPQVQPPQAESPFPKVPIGAFEIRASGFQLWGHIPAPAALVGDYWERL